MRYAAEKNKELKATIKHQNTEVRRLEKDITKAEDKSNKLVNKCEREKRKLKEDLEEVTAAHAVLKRQDTRNIINSNQSKIALERERMELKFEYKLKEGRRGENLASKRDERRARQKDDRSCIGINMLGSAGMLNTHTRGMFQDMVSYYGTFSYFEIER